MLLTDRQLIYVLSMLDAESRRDWINLGDIEAAIHEALELVEDQRPSLDQILLVVRRMLDSRAYISVQMDSSLPRGRSVLSESASETIKRIRAACSDEAIGQNWFVGLFERVDC
jgi:hypothetical protein